MTVKLPTAILYIWVTVVFWATVSHACIDNPMDAINEKAKRQYQLTDEVLDDMKRSIPTKYAELLRVYGIYRACIEGGTGRCMDNADGKEGGACPYCRMKIEDVDKTVTERPEPKVRDSASCKKDEFCYESSDGCFHYGPQGSMEECKNRKDTQWCIYYDARCSRCTQSYHLKNDCPFKCGYCKSHCETCNNHGLMNYTTCTCSCDVAFSGKQCEKRTCPHKTKIVCPGLTHKDCSDTYWSRQCPYECGDCEEHERPTCDNDPSCFITQKGCAAIRYKVGKYYDVDCTNSKDDSACTNKPGGYKCTECRHYSGIQEYPFMCGACI